MKRLKALRIGLIAIFGMFMAMQVHAQATRTWVSGVGDDANPCSRTAPCKTFAGAISKTAAGGEIDVLDPGGFGAVTITKAITIDGSPGSIGGVLVAGTNGIVVNAGANDVVVLRNLDIDGLGPSSTSPGLNGISYVAGLALHVESSRIYGFSQQGINFAPTAGAANSLYVSGTKLLTNAGGAIYVAPTSPAFASVSLTDVVMKGNLRGLRAAGGVNAVIRHCAAVGNSANGFIAGSTDGRTVTLNIDSSTASNNAVYGIYSGVLSTIYISNMQVTGNGGGGGGGGLAVSGGGALISFGNNNVAGNNTTNGAPTQTITTM